MRHSYYEFEYHVGDLMAPETCDQHHMRKITLNTEPWISWLVYALTDSFA